jgi:hypothetical protein
VAHSPWRKVVASTSADGGAFRLQVLSMSEELRRALYAAGGSNAGSFDLDVFGLPELLGATEILTDTHRARLLRHLPARAEGYPWTLVFSTSQHGFSLNSVFRKMAKVESPILMVVQDTENRVSSNFMGFFKCKILKFKWLGYIGYIFTTP